MCRLSMCGWKVSVDDAFQRHGTVGGNVEEDDRRGEWIDPGGRSAAISAISTRPVKCLRPHDLREARPAAAIARPIAVRDGQGTDDVSESDAEVLTFTAPEQGEQQWGYVIGRPKTSVLAMGSRFESLGAHSWGLRRQGGPRERHETPARRGGTAAGPTGAGTHGAGPAFGS